jgi:hypothetical protein
VSKYREKDWLNKKQYHGTKFTKIRLGKTYIYKKEAIMILTGRKKSDINKTKFKNNEKQGLVQFKLN